MSDPFIAEIKMFAGNFAPRGYAFCDGQLLAISQNTALFSLIGTTYGGDGRTTTALPDLQGRAPMHPGNGPGLTSRRLGQEVGVETVTLAEAHMPSHSHTLRAANEPGTTTTPDNNSFSQSTGGDVYKNLGTPVAMASSMQENSGNGQAHNNMQPYKVVNFIIALVGLYPSRS